MQVQESTKVLLKKEENLLNHFQKILSKEDWRKLMELNETQRALTMIEFGI